MFRRASSFFTAASAFCCSSRTARIRSATWTWTTAASCFAAGEPGLLFATLSQGGLAVNALVPKQMVDVLTAVVIIAVATAVPEVRRALAAARREPGTGNREQNPVASSDSGSRFPVPDSPS